MFTNADNESWQVNWRFNVKCSFLKIVLFLQKFLLKLVAEISKVLLKISFENSEKKNNTGLHHPNIVILRCLFKETGYSASDMVSRDIVILRAYELCTVASFYQTNISNYHVLQVIKRFRHEREGKHEKRLPQEREQMLHNFFWSKFLIHLRENCCKISNKISRNFYKKAKAVTGVWWIESLKDGFLIGLRKTENRALIECDQNITFILE